MSENSKIEWCHHTFNPWHGCAKVSPACDNCYAERDSKRFYGDKTLWGVDAERLTLSDSYWKQPIKWNKRSFHERVFCASMADVFDKNAPEGARERLWKLIKDTPSLDWLLLTKRIGNAKTMLPSDWGNGYSNVWLGISVANQEEADRDIPKLLNTEANIRFLSIEPMLDKINIQNYLPRTPEKQKGTEWDSFGIDWVIVGGESGSNARPMHPDWARSIRDQCQAAGVPFLFKQWGEWVDGNNVPKEAEYKIWFDKKRTYFDMQNLGLIMDMKPAKPIGAPFFGCNYYIKVGKHAAGRLLDGRTHDEYPEVKR